eukprot:PhM_4_TR1302/c1_g2_i1/m.105412
MVFECRANVGFKGKSAERRPHGAQQQRRNPHACRRPAHVGRDDSEGECHNERRARHVHCVPLHLVAGVEVVEKNHGEDTVPQIERVEQTVRSGPAVPAVAVRVTHKRTVYVCEGQQRDETSPSGDLANRTEGGITRLVWEPCDLVAVVAQRLAHQNVYNGHEEGTREAVVEVPRDALDAGLEQVAGGVVLRQQEIRAEVPQKQAQRNSTPRNTETRVEAKIEVRRVPQRQHKKPHHLRHGLEDGPPLVVGRRVERNDLQRVDGEVDRHKVTKKFALHDGEQREDGDFSCELLAHEIETRVLHKRGSCGGIHYRGSACNTPSGHFFRMFFVFILIE